MKDLDIVVVGELNADLILQDIPSFPELGKEKLANEMTLTMGSASAILSTNIARLGLEVGFLGKLGKDRLGELVLETLRSRGVDLSGILMDERVHTGVTVVLSYPDDYAMVTYMGAMAEYSVDEVDFEYIQRANHLHLSSIYLQPGLHKGTEELFRKAKEMGLTTSLDPGWDPFEEWDDNIFNTLRHVDIFLPNEQEALHITGTDTVRKALEELSKFSETVVITQGSQGILCYHQGEMIHSQVYPVEPKDTTGAGDSFNAGFLYQWINKGDIHEAIKYGSACGAIATTRLGGGTASPSLVEIEEFLRTRQHDIFNT